MTYLGNYLRAARQSKGLTLDALAGQVSISVPYLHEIEAGKKQCAYAVLERLSVALDVSVDEVCMYACRLPSDIEIIVDDLRNGRYTKDETHQAWAALRRLDG